MDKGFIHRRQILSMGSALGLGTLCAHGQQPVEPVNPKPSGSSFDPRGTLLMCGGGKLPDEILDRFCELGEFNKSMLVLIPTASERSDTGDYSPWLELWKQRGWRDVQIVHAPDRQTVTREDFGKQIEQASAVWITGGDQNRLAQRFHASVLVDQLYKLLARGGVLGGTSAGAAIMSKRMITGGTNEPTMGEGFGLLPEVIVDQHFTQKNRFERLAKAIAMHRDLVGIGIDESTGVELQASGGSVIGQGSVHVYLGNYSDRDKSQPIVWASGQRIAPEGWSRLFKFGELGSKQVSSK